MNNTAHAPFSSFFISQSKSDFHYQHIIRVPAGLFALKSSSCCYCPLPFKLRLFGSLFCKVFYFENCSHLWKTAGVYPKISFCQTIMLSRSIILTEYHSAKILWCQNYQGLVLRNLKLPKVFRKWIDSFELVSLCCISGSSFVGSTKSLLKDDGSTGTIAPCKRAKHQLDSVDLQEDSKNWIQSCPKLTKDDGSSGTITLGPDWYLRHVQLAITGDDGSTGTITASDCTKCCAWGRPSFLFCELFGPSICEQIVANWYLGKVSFDILASQYFGRMIFCQNNTSGQHDSLAKWYLGIHAWPFSKDDCSFQSKTLCKNRFPKQPQFAWQGTVAAGAWFQCKQTCRNPNYVLVVKVWFGLTTEKGWKRRMRCIVHWAKDGERLGCVLSSRVPGRWDALHEHALFEVMRCPYRFSV